MVGRAVLAGAGLGLTAGVAARLAMRLLFLMNPSTEGIVVGEVFPVGGFTAQGTGVVLFQGVVLGALAGLVYGLVRPSLPWRPSLRGLAFGGWLVAAFLGLLIVGEDRDFRLFGPFPVAVGLFGVVFVAFGLGLGYVADRHNPGPSYSQAGMLRKIVTWTALATTGLLGAVILLREIAFRV